MRLASLCLACACALAAPAALARTTYGLVIGIDAYTYVPDLHGAVNDARDIADALTALDAEVTLLLDAEATRAAILGAWQAILAEAQPGDRLVVSFAGHGSNEPEHSPGSERDGRDENFLLAGFAPRGAAAAERIRDDEIAALLAQSAALEVIFVADACHAGTVTRNVDPVLGFRYVESARIAGDPLPPPPPPATAAEGQDDVALFLAAVDESQRVPEVLIDGVPRGALSYAFADGLRGAADRNGDGVLSKGELVSHVRRIVREASDGIQLPQSQPSGQETRALFDLRAAPPPAPEPVAVAPPAPSLDALPFASLPPVPVSGADWPALAGIVPVEFGQLRREDDRVVSDVGDLMASAAAAHDLQRVVDAHRLAEALRALAEPPLRVAFAQGDLRHPTGTPLVIEIDGRDSVYLTVLNLSGDGQMRYLYPLPDLGDPLHLPLSQPFALAVVAAPPIGADYVIAVETRTAPEALRAALRALDGTRDPAGLWDVLRQSGGRLAVFPFFTAAATEP